MKYVGNDKEIVFLNSGNIISDLTGTADYNGVPSHTLLQSSYSELSSGASQLSVRVYSAELSICGMSASVDAKMAAEHAALSAYINQRVATAYKPQGSVQTYDQLLAISEAWKSEEEYKSHIGDVWNVIGSSREDPTLSGQNYVWVFQTDTPGSSVSVWGWDNIGGFVNFQNFYNKTQVDEINARLSNQITSFENDKIEQTYNALTGTVNAVSTSIALSVGVSARKLDSAQAQVDAVSVQTDSIQSYVDYLSCKDYDNPGAILKLSTDISGCVTAGINMLKFVGHIQDVEKLSSNVLTGYFYNSFERGRVKNGSFFDVDFTTPGVEKSQTRDSVNPMVVGNGDIVIVHDHSVKDFIDAKDLILHVPGSKNAGNVYVFKAGVSKYEFIDAIARMNAVKAAAREDVAKCYARISAVGYDATEESCVSCVVEIKNMLSGLMDTLKD